MVEVHIPYFLRYHHYTGSTDGNCFIHRIRCISFNIQLHSRLNYIFRAREISPGSDAFFAEAKQLGFFTENTEKNISNGNADEGVIDIVLYESGDGQLMFC